MKKAICIILALMLILPCFSMISVSAEGENAEIIGASLNIGASFSLDYYVTFEGEIENASMRFTTSNGRVSDNVKGVFDEGKNAYKFTYTGINPQCMTENVKAEFIYKGSVLAQKDEYSVKTYADNLAKLNTSELGYNTSQLKAFRTLLADMLVYGAVAQEYKGYNTTLLANTSSWINVYNTTFAKPLGVREVEKNSDTNNRVTALGVNMANVNRVYFKMVLTDDVTVLLNGETVDRADLILISENNYALYTEDIKATDFDKVYTLTLIKDGSEISRVQYNVNAYISQKYGDANVGAIVRALSSYGTSAKAYLKAMQAQTEGGDFDIEEDVLNESTNYIPEIQSNLNDASLGSSLPRNWGKMGSITVSVEENGYTGNCIHGSYPANNTYNYWTPQLDIKPYIKEAGAYEISFKYKLKGTSGNNAAFSVAVRTEAQTSFTTTSSPFYASLAGVGTRANDIWYTFSDFLYVKTDDLDKGKTWKISLHMMELSITDVYIDDVTVTKAVFKDEPQAVTKAETWVKNEVVLISDRWYEEGFYDVDVDLMLTNGIDTYTVPGFWDGDNTWRVRFVCPTAGTWTYTTVCTDTENKGLHNITNTFECTEYSGDLDIYKHGFVKTEPGKRYFTYADGTPFFYLGDTHWNLGAETTEVTNTVADKRAEQGFTVWQSEPLGSGINFADGVDAGDIQNLRKYDAKFEYIAQKGLVHANAEFGFPSEMNSIVKNNGGYSDTVLETVTHTINEFEKGEDGKFTKKEDGEYNSLGTTRTETVEVYDVSDEAKAYLEKISRYWVARYSAYPVMWTLGQEVDDDFYWEKKNEHEAYSSHKEWCYVNNPYKYVAEYINKHDPYKSALTGHQEYASATAATSGAGVLASTSAFRDVAAHTWYGAQWSPSLTGGSTATVARDFWNNGQGKPVVNYEGRYCYLWTKHYGARAQGWLSFLNGMFGHGYGAQDTWCYLSTYSESDTRDDGVDVITPENKQNATWQDALEYESAYQLCYMRNFFEDTVGDWWNLIPRFDDNSTYFTKATGAYATVASNENNTEIVIYFNNFSDESLVDTTTGGRVNSKNYGTATGTVNKLTANAAYNYMWFNPVTGKTAGAGSFTANASGTWKVPEKATCDMVLYISKAQ